MYLKFQNAAVFVGDTPAKQVPPGKAANLSQHASSSNVTLWATRPFSVFQGRLIAVRKVGQSVEVALVVTGSTSVVWRPADSLLSPTQINHWLSNSSFR